jgi:hypothetical protein
MSSESIAKNTGALAETLGSKADIVLPVEEALGVSNDTSPLGLLAMAQAFSERQATLRQEPELSEKDKEIKEIIAYNAGYRNAKEMDAYEPDLFEKFRYQ